MPGERDLTTLLRAMRPLLDRESYVFAILARDGRVPDGTFPLMAFREKEGLTLILSRQEAEKAGLSATFPCRMITLTIHSALEAVGLLAAVTAKLAAAGIAVNAVSAFHHDHLFVAEDQAEEALRLLENLASA